ncbi:hypothetical protein [Paenibacillus chitinolyticus]|uniref:hypothetical protein n=1 Tax=Paenibacillus chitinolyticus TaxID=79263 RepID=UPI001C48FA33|nr:hypothetical protein [Paenibacillus chitinolyticus]MBV6717269.1 hypothetical protein [Paenibacillus chitinolyticus]
MAIDKLKILNSIPVVETSASGGELEYVLIENNDSNFEKMKQLGIIGIEINDHLSDDGETIDISSLAFTYTKAKWFEPDVDPHGVWLDYVPDHAPDWAK